MTSTEDYSTAKPKEDLAIKQRQALADLIRLSEECEKKDREIKYIDNDQRLRASRLRDGARSRFQRYLTKQVAGVQEQLDAEKAQLDQEKEERLKKFKIQASRERGKILGEIDKEHAKLKQKADEEIWLTESKEEEERKNTRKEHYRLDKQIRSGSYKMIVAREEALTIITRYNLDIEVIDFREDDPFGDFPDPEAVDMAAIRSRRKKKSSEGLLGDSGFPIARSADASRSGNLSNDSADALPARAEPPAIEVSVEEFTETINEIEQHLMKLNAMKLPKLFLTPLPYVIIAVLALVIGGMGYGVGAVLAQTMMISVAIAAGATIIGAAILFGISIVLKANGRKQSESSMKALAETLKEAATKRKNARDTENRRYYVKAKKARRRRIGKIKKIKERFQPDLTNKAKHRRDEEIRLHAEAKKDADDLTRQINKEIRSKTRSLSLQLETNEQQQSSVMEKIQSRYNHRIATIERKVEYDTEALSKRWKTGRERVQKLIEETISMSGELITDWQDHRITNYTPPKTFNSVIRFGGLTVDTHKKRDENSKYHIELPENFEAPALLAFLNHASTFIEANPEGKPAAMDMIKMLMLRLITQVPAGKLRFTIIDPVGLGEAFAGFMHLGDFDENLVGRKIWTEPRAIAQRLTDTTQHMENVIQKYLRNDFPDIDAYNQQAGELAEPYHYLVIADFPNGFDETSLKRLSSIINSGARCGVQVIVHRDARLDVARKATLNDLENHCLHLRHLSGGFAWQDEVYSNFRFTPDPTPDEETLTRLLNIVGDHASKSGRIEVDFSGISPTPDEMWTRSSAGTFQLPIGKSGATRLQQMTLGKGVAQHILIAGKTGSGKSTLLNIMITNAALWYSPDEVRFYLIDFKKGVEFKSYATYQLPHADAIAIESDREFGLSVLERLDEEMTQRGDTLRAAGTQNITDYRNENPHAIMPRIILIIDEFQEFFTEDDRISQAASLLLDRLIRQGRAFGMHVILGSQSLGGVSGLARGTLNQMAVRIALQCAEADSQLILSDNNTAARLLTRPGEAIYNDSSGLIEANSPFQISWLSDSDRDQKLHDIHEYGQTQNRQPSFPVVFEGAAKAEIEKNKQIIHQLNNAPESVLAAKAYIGEPVAIKEATHVKFHRQAGLNVLLLGQQEDTAMGVMTAMLTSLGANNTADGARFTILDGSPADSSLHGRLNTIATLLPQKKHNITQRQLPELLEKVVQEIDMRLQADRTDAKATYLFVFGAQRFRDLRKKEDSFGLSFDQDENAPADPAANFEKILKEGPGVGIHVIAWCDTLNNLERNLGRQIMREFDQRVLFQMSASDSSAIIDTPAANRLGMYKALLYSEESGQTENFRPYGMVRDQWLEQNLNR